MKTYGLIPSQQLVSLQQDDDGNWIDVPEGEAVVPLVKLPQPEATATQKAKPVLVWHADRVDRDWQIIDKTAEEIAADSAKTWPTKTEFWAEFTDAEKLAILDSTIPQIRLLDKELTMWSGSIVSTDARIIGGMSALVTAGILTEARSTAILSNG